MRPRPYPSATRGTAYVGKPDRIHDQRVAFPVSNSMAVGRACHVLGVRMLPAIQIDVPHEGVDFGNQGDLILRLGDIPRRGMLHEEWIGIGEAPLRSIRHHFTPRLSRSRPLCFRYYFRFYVGARD